MSASGVQRLLGNNRFCDLFTFSFVAWSACLDCHKKHEIVCWSPLQAVCWVPSKSWQWPKVFHHFPLKANAKPLVEVKIALYPKIHQAPSLDTLIHVVFPAMAINYVNQGYMDGRTILTTKNTVVNSLNTQIVEVVFEREHVFFVYIFDGNEGQPSYGDWHEISQHHYSGMYATTLHGPESWCPCYFIE